MKTKQKYMKTKSIILSGLLLATLGAATTSCEDMLNVDDELHTKDLAPKDTVYQVMGILNRMQSLVDRTVVLGELRADLVDLNEAVASTALQEVMANNISTDNEYNTIADYYSVINACNVYLAYVDSNYVEHNKKKYEKEIQVVKTYRAWTYLELAKTYGTVPFVLDPVLSSVDADKIVASTTNRADMEAICTYFINDLLPYVQTSAPISVPSYGTVNGYLSQTFFIPARLMVAELYLWRGSFTQNKSDFTSACQYYYDYINTVSNKVPTGVAKVSWNDNTFRHSSDTYSSSFTSDTITIIPMDTCAYDGTWSQLYAMFNSQYENNYYVPVVPSQRIREISRDQINCVYSNINNKRDTIYSTSKLEWEDSLEMGDLRLNSVYHRSAVSNMYTAQYSQDRQHIMKYATSTNNYGSDEKLRYFRVFRKGIVWLHFAEALNRAGYPQTAFAILKYGLTSETMNSYVSSVERNNLSGVYSYINGNIGTWPLSDFRVANSSNVSSSLPANTLGIHSRGSGDSQYNKYYALTYDEATWAPIDSLSAISDSLIQVVSDLTKDMTKRLNQFIVLEVDTLGSIKEADVQDYAFETSEDSLAYIKAYVDYYKSVIVYEKANEEAYEKWQPTWQDEVKQLILDEEALEGMFEGTRFYDLMRYAKYEGDNDYIYKQVVKRKGSDTVDSRAEALRNGNWYLPLPQK